MGLIQLVGVDASFVFFMVAIWLVLARDDRESLVVGALTFAFGMVLLIASLR